MDSSCHDILMVLVGGTIGLLSSLIVLCVQQWLNTRGETKLYYKKTNFPQSNVGMPGWGCRQEGNQLGFFVPMEIELLNTSNTVRVVRDLSLHLYNGNGHIEKMKQIEYVKGKTPMEYGTDNNSYSFTLSPRSIQRQKCMFAYKIHSNQKQAITFDTIKMLYYDEKDHRHEEFVEKGIVDCWNLNPYYPDEDWNLLGTKS